MKSYDSFMKRAVILILFVSFMLGSTACQRQADSTDDISQSSSSYERVSEDSTSTSEPTQNTTSEEETLTEATSTQEAAPQISTSVLITDLASIDKTPIVTDRLVDNWGNSYDYAVTNDLGFNGDDGSFCYEYLNTGFSAFTATLYIPEGENSKDTTAVIIKGDGYILYTSPGMTKTSQPIEINVDVAGFSDIVIEWINNSGYNIFSDLTGCLANPSFEMDSNANGGSSNLYDQLPVSVLDMDSMYSTLKRSNRLVDNHENLYPIALYNKVDNYHSNNIPTYKFLLDGRFEKFMGTLYIPEGAAFSKPVTMTIRADGSDIYTSPEMTVSSEPVNFEVNINGCEILEITYSECVWYDSTSESYLCLAYPYLYGGEGVGNERTTFTRLFYEKTEESFSWGWELFNRDSTDPAYDGDLGRGAIYLCEGTYKGQSVAEGRMHWLGFEDVQSMYYEVDDVLNTSPITIGSVTTEFGGERYLIIAVAIRGTFDSDDVLTDIRSGVFNIDGFSEAGDVGKNAVREYCVSRCEKHQIDMEHTILFVTGHSLGATIAGQIAGDLENEVALRQHIFGYTFASPYYDTKGKNTAEYTNIHNLINTMDDIPDFPLGGVRYGIDHKFLGTGKDLRDQHMLPVYLSGIQEVEARQQAEGHG